MRVGKIGSIKLELKKLTTNRNKQLVAFSILLLLIVIGFGAWWLPGKQQSGSNTASGLNAAITTDDSTRPVLKLTNAADAACQVIESALGTVSITEVKQDGKRIEGQFIEVDFDDSLDFILANELKTLEPGQSVEIPLEILETRSGHVLESIAWSEDTGAFGLEYTLQPDKSFDLVLTYAVPIEVDEGAPACPVAHASTINNGGKGTFIKSIFIAGLIVLIIVALLVAWKLKGKRFHKGTAAIALAISTSFVIPWQAIPVQAEFDVYGNVAEEYANCREILERNDDITGTVLSTIDNRDVVVEVERTSNDYSRVTQVTNRRWRIYWNPDARNEYHGGIMSDPCAVLFHEMYHVYDGIRGTRTRAPCGDSSIPTTEVVATRAENELRKKLDLHVRTHYGSNPLPDGPCRNPTDSIPRPCAGTNERICGFSDGDPHINTFDGLSYDFQAVGEFTLARDPAGDFEVQTRQAPWANSRQVSVNSAVALRVGQDKLELRLLDDTYYLNGKQTKLEDIELKNGSIATFDDRSVHITWDDESVVLLRPIGNFGMAVTVGPAPDRKGKLEGVLGNFDGNKDNDLRLQGSDETIKPEFSELYPKFADSWRVEQDTSLFTYKEGENTDTFTDRGFPDEEATAADVPNRAAAERLCRTFGVIDKTVLENCILDVGLTGRPEFALSAADSQNNSQSIDYGGQHWDVKIDKPHDVVKLPFEGKAGQKVFVEFTGATFTLGGSPTKITDEGGNAISHGGWIIDGEGYIKATKLPRDGKYNIEIDSYETGSVHVQLITTQDQSHSITPDGAMVTTRLSVPGSVADFTFEGKKGEKIFVDIPYSEFRRNVSLIGPGDTTQNRSNISLDRSPTITLEKSGTYTVRLDPQKGGTGEVRLRVVRPETIQTSIQIGGPPVTVKLGKPGSTASLSFDASSGQKVSVDFTDSTFPGLCSNAWLFSPSGESKDNVCIVFGSGSLNKILPESGRYQIIIDPRGRATGEITVSVSPG